MERLRAEDRGEIPPDDNGMFGETNNDQLDFFGRQSEFGGDEHEKEMGLPEEVEGETAEETGPADEHVDDGSLFLPGPDDDQA